VNQAVHREIREEAGIDIEIISVAAVVDLIDRDEIGINHHYTVIDMLAEWRSGDARAGDDAMDTAWVALDEIDRYDLPELQIEVIIQAARQRRSAA
jgi:ADP-ribose pyrophosphatase YjhB (NUDIX family)